jgi:hypothetical protein
VANLEQFYQWLISLFKEGEHQDYDAIKDKMEAAGYGDMTGHDVYNAVNAMIEGGDVFTSEQSSQLTAYTGGNQVSQGAYAPTTTSIGATGGGGAAPAAQAPVYHTPPPPPPLDPGYGATELDAAIRQIVYVNNVSNNTYTEDNDYFSDDDTIIDSSVNQTILADGDVHQDFDSAVAAGESVANTGEIENSAVIGGGVEDSVVAGDDAYLTGSAVGDGNTILNDSDGAIVGDGNTSLYGNDIDGPVALGGDATQAEQIAGGDAIQADGNVNTGHGDQVNAEDSVVGTGGAEATGNTGNMDNSNIGSGEGDINAIQGSDTEGTAFGSGSAEANDVAVNVANSAGVGVSTGDHSDAEGEYHQEIQDVDIDHSAGVGVSNEGDAEGEFKPDLEIDLSVEEQELEYEH